MIDPTPERKWIYKIADDLKLKIILPKKNLQNLNSSDGWRRNLANLPNLTLYKIVAYLERVNKTFITTSKKIEKNLQRGHQFLEENFIDLNSILSKQNDRYFSVEGICSESLKQKD